jgi:hypothetical protein
VIHKDRIIAEKYDTGFDKDSKIWVDDQKHYGHHFGILENRENMIYPNQLQ